MDDQTKKSAGNCEHNRAVVADEASLRPPAGEYETLIERLRAATVKQFDHGSWEGDYYKHVPDVLAIEAADAIASLTEQLRVVQAALREPYITLLATKQLRERDALLDAANRIAQEKSEQYIAERRAHEATREQLNLPVVAREFETTEEERAQWSKPVSGDRFYDWRLNAVIRDFARLTRQLCTEKAVGEQQMEYWQREIARLTYQLRVVGEILMMDEDEGGLVAAARQRMESRNERALAAHNCSIALRAAQADSANLKAEVATLADHNARHLAQSADLLREVLRLKARLEEAGKVIEDLCDEAGGWIEGHYQNTKDYPSELRRYERDIAPVIAGRAWLSADTNPKEPTMTDFRWLIEAPGINYLGVRKFGSYQFHWTKDHDAALFFRTKEQADLTMMAVRQLCPALFAFAVNLGEARPVEHGWMDPPKEPSQ